MANKGGDEVLKFLTKAIQSASRIQQERSKLETSMLLEKIKAKQKFSSTMALEKAKKGIQTPQQEQTMRIQEAEIGAYNQQQGGAGGTTSPYGIGGPTPGGPGTYGPIPGMGQHMAPADAPTTWKAPETQLGTHEERTRLYPQGGTMKRETLTQQDYIIEQIRQKEDQGIPLSAGEKMMKKRAEYKSLGKGPGGEGGEVTYSDKETAKVITQIMAKNEDGSPVYATLDDFMADLENYRKAFELQGVDLSVVESEAKRHFGSKETGAAAKPDTKRGITFRSPYDPVKQIVNKANLKNDAISKRIQELRDKDWSESAIWYALDAKKVKPEDYGVMKGNYGKGRR